MTSPVQWATDINSGADAYLDGSARSGVGQQTFAFGGNPNLALLAPGGVNWWAIAAAAALVGIVWMRRR